MSNLNIKTGTDISLHCPDMFMYPFKRFSERILGERDAPWAGTTMVHMTK